MRKWAILLLCAVTLVAFTAQAEPLTGMAKGFGGELTVAVTLEGDKIVDVTVTSHSETNGIGTKAVDALPAAIVAANSTQVDAVATATVTSKAIIAAVNNAIDPVAYPYEAPVPQEAAAPAVITAADVYQGFGLSNSGRLGPGKDDQGVQVYSINQVYAQVLFDGEGRILAANIDQLEVATPNYDGATMPHFSGFPGQIPYNLDANHDEKVDGKAEQTDDTFLAEIASWQTKRQRGEGYVMGTGYWYQQMDKYEEIFVGKTIEEVEAWFAKYCSDVNGRPLKADSSKEQDVAKYAALTEEEKAMLTDVVTSATMSLKDGHGDILAALRAAYENRGPLTIKAASAMGFGLNATGRLGPGKDDQGVQVYSINEVYACTLFDADDRIAAIWLDQLEVATPNYDGATMPHFSGFPGQGGYNWDENHDEKVDGVIEVTDDSFMAEIASWQTKRQRGDGYVMGTGKWYQQADKFQEIFVGMTVDEVEAWFAKYCSDVNGRPLKADSSKEQDVAKYAALTEEEKAMLADVVTSATMSLQDGHGDILAAIRASLTNKIAIELNVQ